MNESSLNEKNDANTAEIEDSHSMVSDTISLFLRSRPCHQMLQDYADKEYSAENLYFWTHIIKYREMIQQKCDASLIADHEDLMMDMYIREDSEYVLNLSYDIIHRVRLQPHCREIWFEIQKEVAQLIRQGPYLHLSSEITRSVSESWKKVLDRVSVKEAGTMFYQILFTKAPHTRLMFSSDMLTSKKAEMLPKMINTCVSLLVELEQLVDVVVDLGRRHALYGVSADQFQIVGETLLDLLEQVLDKDFDEQTQRAWTMVYELISTLMIMVIDPAQINKFIVHPPENLCHLPKTSKPIDPEGEIAVTVGERNSNPQKEQEPHALIVRHFRISRVQFWMIIIALVSIMFAVALVLLAIGIF